MNLLTKQWTDTWTINDVRELGIRPDLSDEQIATVLDKVFSDIDAEQGINYYVINSTSYDIFKALYLSALALWDNRTVATAVYIDMDAGTIRYRDKDKAEIANSNAEDMVILFCNTGKKDEQINSAASDNLFAYDSDLALEINNKLRDYYGEEMLTHIRNNPTYPQMFYDGY